jgi:phage terminase large subunit
MVFYNGSRILFKHCNNINDQDEYQGLEFDVIFMDEATQFTEVEFRMLGACLRGVNKYPKRFYLTCNPGGIGHQWVKRLFVSRNYDPAKFENGRDYFFIPATVDDNAPLLESTPEYIQMLDVQPESVRRAWRFGDWDALSGQFFTSFTPKRHVIDGFKRIPDEWIKYRAFDYGLDMLACLWIAVDFNGRAYVYREVNQPGLIVSDAARLMLDMTPEHERIAYTIAPPDMWSTNRETGKTQAETFMQNGLGLLRAPNSRIAGWSIVNEYLKDAADSRPMLLISSNCGKLIENLPILQRDDKNPDDVAKEPHEITHNADALRYFCASRSMKAEKEQPKRRYYDDDNTVEDYEDAMTGGKATNSYLMYG